MTAGPSIGPCDWCVGRLKSQAGLDCHTRHCATRSRSRRLCEIEAMAPRATHVADDQPICRECGRPGRWTAYLCGACADTIENRGAVRQVQEEAWAS